MRFKTTWKTTAQFSVIIIYCLVVFSFSLIQADVLTSDQLQHTAVQEYCHYETFSGRCWRGEVIVMQHALWGRIKPGRCLQVPPNFLEIHGNDRMFIGCFRDVLPLADSTCSGRPECSILISDPSFNNIKPCYADLKMYFEASFQCVRVVQESRRCVVSVTTEAQFISSSSSTASGVNSVSSCGSRSHPWRLEAAAGQRINISLLDFTATSMSAADRSRDLVTCRQYGYALEKLNKRNVSVCGGGGAELRRSHVYISHSSNVQIVQMSSATTDDRPLHYLLRIEAVGCTNMIPPENAWLRRSNNDISIGCYSSQQTWQLKCDGREWKGLVGTCPELYTGTIGPVVMETTDYSVSALVVIFSIATGALVICITVICIGCLCLQRYKRNAMEKMNTSNGCTTDVYLPNSRCIRNNDKPVDNNVFTGRLPVSNGSQHHHWQQHQQLLIQGDDASQNFFPNSEQDA